ncbi:MAG TPA: hypothetical protein PLN71_06785, partial [Anaerolineae bacterium]|nr:hypothetical protein [Anaerolineae bacterium]
GVPLEARMGPAKNGELAFPSEQEWSKNDKAMILVIAYYRLHDRIAIIPNPYSDNRISHENESAKPMARFCAGGDTAYPAVVDFRPDRSGR